MTASIAVLGRSWWLGPPLIMKESSAHAIDLPANHMSSVCWSHTNKALGFGAELCHGWDWNGCHSWTWNGPPFLGRLFSLTEPVSVLATCLPGSNLLQRLEEMEGIEGLPEVTRVGASPNGLSESLREVCAAPLSDPLLNDRGKLHFLPCLLWHCFCKFVKTSV